MAGVHELSRADARRIALQAQLLTSQRPTDLVETVRQLPSLQLDPTRAIAPSAELVLWSRLGSSYSAGELWDAVDELRLIELRGSLRVADDIALYRAEMKEWPGSGDDAPGWRVAQAAWVQTNNACRLDILDRLRADGPLPKSELPDSCVLPWASSGWNNNKNLTMMLGFLVASGEVAAAGGTGRDRLWDLASRIYPDDPVVPADEARQLRNRRHLSSLGILRARGPEHPVEGLEAGTEGEPAVVEGVRGEWRVDPTYVGRPFEGRAALLSPFDRVLTDRKRVTEIFEFDYLLEMYKPEAKRRWGYYALPILYGDRFVGKLDARADRKDGAFRVAAVHQDVRFGKAMTTAIDREIEDLARWLDLELERFDRLTRRQ